MSKTKPDFYLYFEVNKAKNECSFKCSGLGENEGIMLYEAMVMDDDLYAFVKNIIDVMEEEIENKIINN